MPGRAPREVQGRPPQGPAATRLRLQRRCRSHSGVGAQARHASGPKMSVTGLGFVFPKGCFILKHTLAGRHCLQDRGGGEAGTTCLNRSCRPLPRAPAPKSQGA